VAEHIRYFVSDIIEPKGRDLPQLPFSERRDLLKNVALSNERIRISEYLNISAETMLAAVKEQRLEGVVSKRADRECEPGLRSGACVKFRVNSSQVFVVGGYTPAPMGLTRSVVGYYKASRCKPAKFARPWGSR
jgi:bifunctional non-homologous end joining protein LigD